MEDESGWDRSQLRIKFQAEAVDGHVISAKLLGCFIFFGKVIKGVSGKSAEGLPVFTDIFVCVCAGLCLSAVCWFQGVYPKLPRSKHSSALKFWPYIETTFCCD